MDNGFTIDDWTEIQRLDRAIAQIHVAARADAQRVLAREITHEQFSAQCDERVSAIVKFNRAADAIVQRARDRLR